MTSKPSTVLNMKLVILIITKNIFSNATHNRSDRGVSTYLSLSTVAAAVVTDSLFVFFIFCFFTSSSRPACQLDRTSDDDVDGDDDDRRLNDAQGNAMRV